MVNICSRLIVVMLYLLIAVEGIFAQNSKPKIVFSILEHNFGRFKEEEGSKSYVFEFVNNGGSPLIILDVQNSCGCTTPEWTQKPIPPGGKGSIKVSYDPSSRPGPFSKEVTILTNGNPYKTELRVSGDVISRPRTLDELYPRRMGALLLRSNHMSFSTIKVNQIKTDTLLVMNSSEKPLSVEFRDIPSHLTIRLAPGVLQPQSRGNIIIIYDATKVGAYGYKMDKIFLKMNGSKSDNFIVVTATIEEDFSKLTPEEIRNAPKVLIKETRHDFGNIKSGQKETHTFVITNSGINDLLIRNINNYCSNTVLTPSSTVIKGNSSAKLKVVFDSSGLRGRQNKSISIITNDPHNPTLILRVSAYIQPK